MANEKKFSYTAKVKVVKGPKTHVLDKEGTVMSISAKAAKKEVEEHFVKLKWDYSDLEVKAA